MVMQISSSTSFAAASAAAARPPEQRQAFKDLSLALRAGDLGAAKQAYGALVRSAPDGITWNPDSPFAQVGKALVTGDMAAAKSAYAAMVKSHLPRNDNGTPTLPPQNETMSGSTGEAVGLLNVTA